MPYGRRGYRPSSRKKGFKKRTWGRKKRTSKRKGYGKKVTHRRFTSNTRGRAINRYGYAGLPMQIATKVPSRLLTSVTFTDTLCCYPEDDSTGYNGAWMRTMWANCPNDVFFNTTTNILGAVGHANGNGSNTSGNNKQLLHLFADYVQFRVTSAKLEITATPMDDTKDETWNWCDEALIVVGCTDVVDQWCAGTTVGSLTQNENILNSRATVFGKTRLIEGAAAKSCHVKSVYSPKSIFAIGDVADTPALIGGTNSAYTATPTYPINAAYWRIGIIPATLQPASAGGATFKMGVPKPHTLRIKATYYLEMSEPISDIQNAPVQ